MTKVHNLLRSCFTNIQKSILLDTSYANMLLDHFTEYRLSTLDKLNTFDNFDTIIIDQSNLFRVESLYKQFLSNIIIIDDVSYGVDQTDISYWNKLKETYKYYNDTYKAICVATNETDYINSNYSHNYLVNITNGDEWRSIV